MADDDKDIWDSSQTDVPEQEAPQTEVAQEQPDTTPRDERGRFAPKTAAEQAAETAPAQAAPEATAEQPREATQGIPPWRLKEEADARRAAEERATRHEQELNDIRRQFAQMQKQNEPKADPLDIFENPAGFVDQRNQEAINPIKSEISQLREFYSQRDAVREHGAEKVKAAYDALDQALRSRDPEANAIYQRAMSSLDPYGDIMKWHQKQTIYSTIGTDPDAFVERQLEEKLKDPAYQAKLMEKLRGAAQTRPSTVTPLPPSLNRASSVAPPGADGDDDSEGGLLKSALHR